MIKRIFGVHIPPKKKPNREAIATMVFSLTGTIPSKKNRQTAAINRKIALQHYDRIVRDNNGSPITRQQFIEIVKSIKPYIRPGDGFTEWYNAAKQQISEQFLQWTVWLREKGIEYVYPAESASIKIYHYWKDNIERDNSNKAETIHDLFKDCGIIAGDNWQCLTPTNADAELYKDEIFESITTIHLTLYKKK